MNEGVDQAYTTDDKFRNGRAKVVVASDDLRAGASGSGKRLTADDSDPPEDGMAKKFIKNLFWWNSKQAEDSSWSKEAHQEVSDASASSDAVEQDGSEALAASNETVQSVSANSGKSDAVVASFPRFQSNENLKVVAESDAISKEDSEASANGKDKNPSPKRPLRLQKRSGITIDAGSEAATTEHRFRDDRLKVAGDDLRVGASGTGRQFEADNLDAPSEGLMNMTKNFVNKMFGWYSKLNSTWGDGYRSAHGQKFPALLKKKSCFVY